MILYNYYFEFLDADDRIYDLRQEQLSKAYILYRDAGSVESFTYSQDWNVDESTNRLWVRLPAKKVDIVINLEVGPLRTITTALITLELVPYTTGFRCKATPVPVNSLQGFSPRIIENQLGQKNWFQYDDTLGAFVDTGIPATGTVITEATEIVDKAEKDNLNPITSNAVYNIYNEQQTINNQVDNHFTNIENRLGGLEDKPDVSVILNGTKHEQNTNGEIDLGEIETTPNTHMLSQLTEIDGKWYPKGTEVDDNNKVYATDGLYYDRCDTKQIDGKSHFILFTLRPGWYRVSYQVYNTTTAGDIYVSRQGERGWSVVTTSKQVAGTFELWRSSAVSSPDLCVRASSGYYIGNFNVVSDQNVRINKLPLNLDASMTERMQYFLTDYEQDTITIETNNYKMNDMTITHFVVDVDGPVSVEAPDTGIGSSNDFSFTATHDGTTIVFNDGTQTITSDEFNTGTRAELIYVSPDEYYWNYYEDASLQVKDVKVDGTTVVANRVAYIYSFTTSEVESIKDLFR